MMELQYNDKTGNFEMKSTLRHYSQSRKSTQEKIIEIVMLNGLKYTMKFINVFEIGVGF